MMSVLPNLIQGNLNKKYKQVTLTKKQRQYNGRKIVFSRDGTGTTGHSDVKNESRHRP